jgi:ABC-type phosphate/phosphonate transport system substrate-binding protein
MNMLIAALPMYDWPETRAETDAEWARIRDRLSLFGIDAPKHLARRNADLPPVPGGIRDASGQTIAPDPASLPPDEFDLHTLWVHPNLMFAQTCWGPMEMGLARHVQVIGQPNYDAFEGGQGALYSSAIVMRSGDASLFDLPSRATNSVRYRLEPSIPLERLRGKRLAFNSADSISGIIALTRDLDAVGIGLDIFAECIETGAHRASVAAVVDGRADVCAIDCRSWAMMKRFRDVRSVEVVGWTDKRKGLPFITARTTPADAAEHLRQILQEV